MNSNWTPSGVPDANNEGALFTINGNPQVTLGDFNYAVNLLQVADGDVGIAFVPPPPDFPFDRREYAANSFDVSSAPGDSAALTLAHGDLRIHNSATVGAGAGSSGRVTLASTQAWYSESSLTIGGAGLGRVDLLAGFRVIPQFGGDIYFTRQAVATSLSVLMAAHAGSSATANVNGTWETGDFIVGQEGSATVNVLGRRDTPSQGPLFGVASAGSIHSTALSIAAEPGSSGVVNLFTPHALTPAAVWNTTGNFSVGGTSGSSGGTGRLALGLNGRVFVGGDLRLWSGGTLSLEQSGALTVAGSATLDGALEFNPSPPAQSGIDYEILTATSVVGAFSSITVPPLASGMTWAVHYNPDSVVLEVASALAGDFDEDGNVDGPDLTNWKTGFGAGGASHMQGDADADADADGSDFLVWQKQFGAGVETMTSLSQAPEPTSASLLCLGTFLAQRFGCGVRSVARLASGGVRTSPRPPTAPTA